MDYKEDSSIELSQCLIISMVGLPARGKSYISRKLRNFLSWSGNVGRIFNFGMYRRTKLGVHDHTYFDPNNQNAKKERDQMALDALEDLTIYLNSGEGDFVIIDATNNEPQRRKMLTDYFKRNMDREYQVLWIESICDIPNIIEKNILKVKVNSDDYKGWNDPEKAANDFRERIKAYEKTYIPLSPETDGEDATYIQIINNSQEIKVRNLKGELNSQILEYLVNLHTFERPIYFIEAGDSENDLRGILGGDADLCKEGISYAEYINNFFVSKLGDFKNFQEECKVYCSTKKQSSQTAKRITCFKTLVETKLLDEMNYGLQDGITEEEFFKIHPDEKAEKERDPLNYRYPRGESYIDVIERVQKVINDIERTEGPVIIIVKKSVFRCLYGYFAFEAEIKNIENIPSIEVPSDTIIQFTPEAYGFKKEVFKVDRAKGFRKFSEIFTKDLSVFYDPSIKSMKLSPHKFSGTKRRTNELNEEVLTRLSSESYKSD